MTIEEYIEMTGSKLKKLAELSVYNPSTINKLRRKKYVPTRHFVRIVRDVTMGKVREKDLIPDPAMKQFQENGRPRAHKNPYKKKAAAEILSSTAAGVPSIDGEPDHA